ncbi:hypothetical protein MAM1_0043c03004 [Mucor ambiguus]|uniref:Uncharacterized protein n=1 Tax=Mucor ambiguus TaxID=91626 RepID=A0A0C9M8P8_9FUNG|nr:hypothetical protein MAM1_0043c03004 [Mucor ambiguus]
MTRINSNGAFKPDFLVYNIAKGTKCVFLVAKFKPTTEQDSYVELDLAMKSRMNKLITNSVAQPKTCGIHCEGEGLQTYVMDLSCAKLYRMTNLSKIKLFKHTNQISLMPNVLTHLVCLKAVTQETAVKAEAVTLYSCKHLKRHASNPPQSGSRQEMLCSSGCQRSKTSDQACSIVNLDLE